MIQKDYAKRKKSSPGSSSAPAISLRTLFLGLLLGMLIAGVTIWEWQHLSRSFSWDSWQTLFQPQRHAAPVSSESPPTHAELPSPRARFEFYTVLPEMEIAIPNHPVKPSSPVTPAKNATTPTKITKNSAASIPPAVANPTAIRPSSTQFVLQLASFKRYEEAERLKAQLTLSMGLEMEIHSVHMATGETWYRVRSKPYAELKKAQADRDQLRAQKIQSLLLKVHG